MSSIDNITLDLGNFQDEIRQDVTIAKEAQRILKTSVPGSAEQKQAAAKAEAGKDAIVKIADKYPTIPVAAQTAGQALVGLKDYDRAAPLAQRAVGLAQERGDAKALKQALMLRGDVHYGKKEYAAALSDAEAVLKGDPTNKAALELKFASAGRGESAGTAVLNGQGHAENIGASAPTPTSASTSGSRSDSVITQTAERQRSDALLRKASQRMRIDPTVARSLIGKALLADPKNERAHLAQAQERRAAGDFAGADAALDRAIGLQPGFAEAHAAKASLAVALGRSAQEVKREYLASGRAEIDFSNYYRDQISALGSKSSDGTALGLHPTITALPHSMWPLGAVSPTAGAWILGGSGLALFFGFLFYVTRRKD